MKTFTRVNSQNPLTIIFSTLVILTLFNGCQDKCTVENRYNYYEPVYTTTAEIRAAVKMTSPQIIADPGKIYIKDSWLFVNEVGKGIHIIDNTDPSKPVIKNFLAIPGNYDLSVKGNILYADSYIDLVAIDISDVLNAKVVKRLEGIFLRYSSLGFTADATKGIITEWVPKDQVTINESNCSTSPIQPWGGVFYDRGIAIQANASFSSKAAVAPNNATGIGGSMSRFAIDGKYLYLLDNGNLQTVSIENISNPITKSQTFVAWDAETIFPYNGNLFFGSQTGMHIYSLAEPEKPKKLSLYSHVRQCDPVVVEGDLAYVTLRSGTTCQGFSNQLEVIDVKDLTNPVLLTTYPMTNPHGLGIDNKTLFVCDGDDGLKVYDASDYKTISANQVAHYKSINTYDVIPHQNVAIMTGRDGIYQFDYSNLKDIKLLSSITLSRR